MLSFIFRYLCVGNLVFVWVLDDVIFVSFKIFFIIDMLVLFLV